MRVDSSSSTIRTRWRGRGGAAAAGQDDLLERRQIGVPGFDRRLEARDLLVADHRVARDADLAAEIEEIVLHVIQQLGHLGRQLLCGEHAERAIQLVQVAERAHAQAVLRDARAVAQAGLAAIAGARRDLRQAMRHARDYRSSRFFTLLCREPCARVVNRRSPSRAWDASRSTSPAALRVMLYPRPRSAVGAG